MAGMGPPPKQDGQRRRTNAPMANVRKLPAAGRSGPEPPWPLASTDDFEAQDLEMDLWSQLWATPQAVAWEEQGWTRVVARYTRLLVMAEGGAAALLIEVRQLEDRLGLSPMAMLRLRWEVEVDAAPAAAKPPPRRPTPTGRPRLRAVEGGRGDAVEGAAGTG